MSMLGNLIDMAVADLIQHNCQDRKTAQLSIQNGSRQAVLFFKDGNIVHATSGDQNGEEVVYRVLGWEEGTFNLETGIEPPEFTINRNWSGLLMEGARRLDESKLDVDIFVTDQSIQPEVNKMAPKLDEILKEMGGEITGYVASAVVGMDGINVAQHAHGKVDPEAISAQMTLLLKLVDTSVTKLGAGMLEDNLTTTAGTYVMMRFLPDRQYYLGLAVDRKTGNLGNMRLISKMFAERIAKAMPH
jgi:predicted regulator of Ras-like GTPase activity (Roadblock/LC7/MglB family)